MKELRYNHDCSECIYLGTYRLENDHYLPITEYDLYAHKRETIIELIARYGNNPSDCLTSCYFLGYSFKENPCLETPIFKEIFDRYNQHLSIK